VTDKNNIIKYPPIPESDFEYKQEDSSYTDRIAAARQLEQFAPKLTFGQKVHALYEGDPPLTGAADPDFRFTQGFIKDLAQHVPPRHLPLLLKAKSREQAIQIKDNLSTLEGQFRADFHKDLPSYIFLVVILAVVLAALVGVARRAIRAAEYPRRVVKGAVRVMKEKADELAARSDK